MTCWRSCGPTENSPVTDGCRRRSVKTETAIPIAKIASAMAQVSRLLQWTMAMATSAQSPWSRIAGPFDRADRRLADDNALTPRLECAMQIADDLALHCPLGLMRGL